MQVTLKNFQLLHNYLMSILSTNNFQQEHLPQKIMQYIGMIVQSQKNPSLNEDFFDYFCESGGNKILKLTLQVQPMLSVKILSMLFINLTSHYWISYLLCQSFIIDAIQYQDIPKDQQWSQYYISLLKSLSIRLNEQQLSLFYNKRFCKFPLLYESLKYYNHPDCMVRTNVMNIILGIMKIKDHRLNKYFGHFPFTSYVITYCCQIKSRIDSLNKYLGQIASINIYTSEKNVQQRYKSVIKSYYIDLIDYICYLNDLMELGSVYLSFFVQNCIFAYVLLPNLRYLKQQSQPLLTISTLLLYFVLFKTITNQKFKLTLCLLLTARKLPTYLIKKIQQTNIDIIIYTPKVYSQQFQPNKYYWNKFDYQIQKQCVKLFEDVNNFQTQHQTKAQDMEQRKKFIKEIAKISGCLGFDILTYGNYENTVPITELISLLGFQYSSKQPCLQIKYNLPQQLAQLKQNPLRSYLFSWLQISQANPILDSLVLTVYTILNNLSKCETIDNKYLQYCGILTPKLDIINYIQTYNKQSMDKICSIGLPFIKSLIQNYSVKKNKQSNQDQIKKDLGLFSLTTIKNFIVLFFDSLYQRLSEEEETLLKNLYKNSILELKQLVVKKNMKNLVQKFQIQYTKWTKQAFLYGIVLNHSILMPRKSAKQITSEQQQQFYDNNSTRQYFISEKQRLLYFIQKFALIQAFYFKYQEYFKYKKQQESKKQQRSIMKEDQNGQNHKKHHKHNTQSQFNKITKQSHQSQRYTTLYHQKYGQIQQSLKLGQSYKIGFKHMVECFSQQKNQKNTKKLIIVQDPLNLIIVQPSSEQNSAKIRINHPWKYVLAEIDRQTGKKMLIRLQQCFRGEKNIELFFTDQRRNAGTLQWMNGLKYQRYMSEQAFILSYLKQCLAKL